MAEQFISDDLWCVSFLLLNKARLMGTQPDPVRRNRWQFVVEGKALTELARQYYINDGNFQTFRDTALSLRHKLYECQAMGEIKKK